MGAWALVSVCVWRGGGGRGVLRYATVYHDS